MARRARRSGARFKGHVKRNGVGPTYWSACRVTACVPNEVFEFVVEVDGPVDGPVNRWGYRLEPDGDGTLVTEYFKLGSSLPIKAYWLRPRPAARPHEREGACAPRWSG